MTSPSLRADAAFARLPLALRISPSALLAASLLVAASCSSGGGGPTGDDNPGGGGPGVEFRLNEVSSGFGLLLPHTLVIPGTNNVVALRSQADIVQYVFRGNPIQPPVNYPEQAIGPDGMPGNHYLFANFTDEMNPLDVLSPNGPGASGNGLAGAATMTAIDGATGASFDVLGRAFVGGQTMVLENGQARLQTWVTLDSATGLIVPNPAIPEAQGFPGAGTALPNAETLVSPSTILFVADDDGDLTSFDAFPSGVTLRFRATDALTSASGEPLEETALAAANVGDDLQTPELLRTPPPTERPLITPGNGDVNVDPETTIRFEFTEPVQPYSVGELVGQGPPMPSGAIQLTFGPVTGPTSVPMNIRPVSPLDLSVYEIIPGYALPSVGANPFGCSAFSTVEVALAPNQLEDLASRPNPSNPGQGTPNFNTRSASTFFETAEGTGVVNAPVAPDVVFVGRSGSTPGLSVLDLNGFGQSTGNPTWSAPFPLEGESRFPFDPNFSQNSVMVPMLSPGACTIDGGSAGVFTLTLTSELDDLVATAPTLANVSEVHFAHALDSVFSGSPPPFGCQAGGGNLCALDGLKVIAFGADSSQPNTLQPVVPGAFGGFNPGYENIISWSPHPNPPRITFPPLCTSPFLASQEPTSIAVSIGGTASNLLGPGNPFPDPAAGTAPTGLLTREQNQFFLGPSPEQALLEDCEAFQIRQQIGHLIYVADRARNEVVVFNSNRMVVVDRIPVFDPVSMAVSPNLNVLAVASQLRDEVVFIGLDPTNLFFHQVRDRVQVGNSPRALAFDPMSEDLLVCNELDATISIISASNRLVRKTVETPVGRPFELAATPRMLGFSFDKGVYYAYILHRSGACTVFESGPSGVNGWGFDDVIGTLPFEFKAPKAIQIDPRELDASVYVAHEGPIDLATGAAGSLGDGAISRVLLSSATLGSTPLNPASGELPNFRDLEFSVEESLGQMNGHLTGIPIDLAFDNQRNIGGTLGPRNDFSAGSPIPANNKATLRLFTQLDNTPKGTSAPAFMFAAIPEPIGGGEGVVDVLDLETAGVPLFDTNPYTGGVQSIPAPGVSCLSDYFKQ